jgi:hypothetical protein
MTDGNKGPGLWIRVKHRFGPRMMEWYMGGHMFRFDYVLWFPSKTFNQPSFLAFRT